MSYNPKHLTLLKTKYDPKAGTAEVAATHKAFAEMSETEQQQFNDFAHVVGNHFLQLMEDLDDGLTELADRFPDETDPRKWDWDDWLRFEDAIDCHKYEEFYRTYAKQEPNLHLVWQEITNRLG